MRTEITPSAAIISFDFDPNWCRWIQIISSQGVQHVVKECVATLQIGFRMEKLLQGWYQPWSFSIPFLSNLLKNIRQLGSNPCRLFLDFTEYGLKEAQRILSQVGNTL